MNETRPQTVEQQSPSLKDMLLSQAQALETKAQQPARYVDLIVTGMASLIAPTGIGAGIGSGSLLLATFGADIAIWLKAVTSASNPDKLASNITTKDGKEIKYSTHVMPFIAKAYRQVANLLP